MMALSGGTEAIDFGHNRCSCSGCYGGGCYGGGCFGGGCFGGGCHGGRGHHGGRRCHGCMGGCYGGYACMGGCMGGGYGCMGGGYGCMGGGYGCMGGGCMGCGGGMMMPAGTVVPQVTVPATKMTQGPVPATIIVSIPTNARLTVDGQATTSTSNRRTLVTPALEQGSEYVYTLRAEMTNEGQTSAQEQVVRVRAGEITEHTFNFPAQGVASR
jgi:uncharacterized protein (TIGR03000 family)